MKTLNVTGLPDARDFVEYEEPFKPSTVSYCTYCGERTKEIIVVKQHWSNRPKGQLVSRCPQHWAKWLAR